MLRLSGMGAVAPTFGSLIAETSAAGEALQQTHPATATRCIFIFLCGGPSQLDMWDPKPDAPDAIRGPFTAIPTSIPGVRFGELLPLTAQRADKLAIIRSMTHDSNVHDVGIAYTLLADSNPPTQKAFPPTRSDHPGLGAILRELVGDTGALPAWVTIPRAFTTGNRFYKGQSGGFLGPAGDPFFLDAEPKDSLADKTFSVEALRPPEAVDAGRFRHRRELLHALDGHAHEAATSAAAQAVQHDYERAFALIDTDAVRGAFDLAREPEALRDRYGRNEYGQSFLLARRLVAAGVTTVNVFWTYYGPDGCQFNLWDNHGSDQPVCGGYKTGLAMIRAPYCCPAFDRAFAALIDDLADGGLLDETLIVVTGEFGRTPKINKNAGRDHWGMCYSTVLAGGGVRGGQVYGASDAHAAWVKHSPVRPEDLGATVLHAFGFPPEAEVLHPTGRPVRASKGRPVTALF
ncbi:MAG: DUF1501 domain-containing protein [Planctomycetes bacterium]|nr:DUF1501 domain-containing protein [Planctomycetota bacterium]